MTNGTPSSVHFILCAIQFISLHSVVVARNSKVLFILLPFYKVIPGFIHLNVNSHLVCDDVSWEAMTEECDLVGVLGTDSLKG